MRLHNHFAVSDSGQNAKFTCSLYNFINVNYQLDAGWHHQTISKDQQCDVFTLHPTLCLLL